MVGDSARAIYSARAICQWRAVRDVMTGSDGMAEPMTLRIVAVLGARVCMVTGVSPDQGST
ncbi:hypothetical protein GA0115240_11772 [Streptomyces sp. DvalAA-14]|nr:hypothetical protein GA0115240_11772 [Streptomyces sp. DvalAA-14]